MTALAVQLHALREQPGGRVTHLHIKDARLDERVPSVAGGAGDLDVDSILAAGNDKVWVIEFDPCATDVVAASAESLRYVAGRRA